MEPHDSPQEESLADTPSTRSRASSVVSTGTKTSIGTMGTFLTTNTGMHGLAPSTPVEEQVAAGSSIDILLGRRNFRISARPGSMLSVSSYDHPAPPYQEAIKSPAVPLNYHSSSALDGQVSLADTSSSQATLVGNQEQSTKSAATAAASTGRNNVLADSPTCDDAGLDGLEQDGDERSFSEASRHRVRFSLEGDSARNAISQYYTDIVRQIDSNHQSAMAQLQASLEAQLSAQRTELEVVHDTELEELRSSMKREHTTELAAQRNEIDSAYRAEFGRMVKAYSTLEDKVKKDSDDMRASTLLAKHHEKEAANLRIELQARDEEMLAERSRADDRERIARNEVEDVWEGRWRQRMALAADQVGKAEQEASRWAALVEERWGSEAAAEMQQRIRDDIAAENKPRTRHRPARSVSGSIISTDSAGGGSSIISVTEDSLSSASTSITADRPRKKLWPSFGGLASPGA